ncbi:putative inner membrane protein [Salmonella enterica subsp. enterica serovar Paratyphi A]|nr:putative inner membrane protein [Salmonella enterica subsp. enterica serovar Paratyphi A]
MNDQIYQRIEDSARFRELVEKRQRFATILSVIMLAVYISFILLIAFAPGWARLYMREPASPEEFPLASG